jgi:hypothetical protein
MGATAQTTPCRMRAHIQVPRILSTLPPSLAISWVHQSPGVRRRGGCLRPLETVEIGGMVILPLPVRHCLAASSEWRFYRQCYSDVYEVLCISINDIRMGKTPSSASSDSIMNAFNVFEREGELVSLSIPIPMPSTLRT